MGYLVTGLVLFLGVHSVALVAPAWRDQVAARMGNAWRGLYSLVSIAGLVLIIWGYGIARQNPILLYAPPAWTRYVTAVLMLPAFPLFLAAYFPGRIKSALQHPMLISVMLWSLAHLISTGMLANVVLFGGFLAWAVADRISYGRLRPLMRSYKASRLSAAGLDEIAYRMRVKDPSPEAVMDLGTDLLEYVAGGSDGSAVGHN